MSYKKRAKSGYNNDKKSSNRSERTFEKQEVKNESNLVENIGSYVDPVDKFESSGRRTGKKIYKYPELKEIKSIEKKITSNEKWLRCNDKYGFSGESIMSKINMRRKTELIKLKSKLVKLQEKLDKKKEIEVKDE